MPARARRSYHHGHLADALLSAAEALIARSGMHAFSLREAARRVGVDPSACYRHFQDREALLRALARRGAAHLALRMEQARHGGGSGDAAAALARMLRAYAAAALERPALFRALLSEG